LESSLREGEKDRLGRLNFRTIPAAGESKFMEEDAQIILSNRKKMSPSMITLFQRNQRIVDWFSHGQC